MDSGPEQEPMRVEAHSASFWSLHKRRLAFLLELVAWAGPEKNLVGCRMERGRHY